MRRVHELGGCLATCLVLAGCSTPQPRTVEVRVPVPVPCVAEAPARPALAWDDLAGAPVYEQVRALLIDRGRLVVHSDELRAVLAGCATPSSGITQKSAAPP